MLNGFFGNFNALKDFDKLFVGFDEQFGRISKLHTELVKQISTFPPTNIRKIADNQYLIELAVAGYDKDALDIEVVADTLIVRGKLEAKEDPQDSFIVQGIANRAFTRSFVLNDKVEVRKADLDKGMLRITLERAPVEKPVGKKVEISD